ncbi:hypothetical protein [Spirosoma foliorum]|uniref:Lipocalin-like domain-containing protein n=1 Tax=Spirosoma foliorum TaxID=2710596 RepID=A0A7G5GTV1_9BACT|nr:hypothetical protein [Spirosoma foliorum]QMW02293.1 hypothetical protein H3H32_30950 [Spirosoma foliorum]
MIKLLYISLIVLILIGCNGGLSNRTFEGNTYQATLRLDSTNINDELGSLISGATKMEYVFGKNEKGSIRSVVGAVSNDHPITWEVKNDSLILTSEGANGVSSKHWGITKNNEGYLINDGKYSLQLVKE